MSEAKGLLARAWARLSSTDGEAPRAPREIFDDVLAEKARRYEGLKQAAASVLYLRNRLEGDLLERRAELARVHGDLLTAVRSGDEPWAVELAAEKQDRHQALARAEQDLAEVRAEAEEVKELLVRRHAELRALERERLRILGALAHAEARHHVEAALGRVTAEGRGALDLELEGVRERVAKLSMERALERELSGEALPATIGRAPGEGAYAEVRRLRESLGRGLEVVPPASAGRGGG